MPSDRASGGIRAAPQHPPDLRGGLWKHAYIIESVAYSPLKMTYLHPEERRGDERVFCTSCDWEVEASELPKDAGIVVPDLCPECAKHDELGFVDTGDDPSIGLEVDDTEVVES